jgi:exoribonuclease-2
MDTTTSRHRSILRTIARRAMSSRGLLVDFSDEVEREVAKLASRPPESAGARDLRDLLWCSIDNDDSTDLDQLTVAEALPDGRTRVRVAVADVTALVERDGAVDAHAGHNTTSVYTAAQVFPMLPDELSSGLTSLNPGEPRLAVVVEMAVSAAGEVESGEVARAWVVNRAKLAYNGLAAWLDGTAPTPPAVAAVPGLEATIRLQDRVAQAMHESAHARGSLGLRTLEARAVFDGELLSDLELDEENRTKQLIQSFMVAANQAVARFLEGAGMPSLRRVVREPRRWDRIVELAAQHGTRLPGRPDGLALESFLHARRAADPERFPDLSLAVVKLLGSGEYVAELPGHEAPGHFGLAVSDYGHATAPNRRYPDLITQRLVKAALAGRPCPYSGAELTDLAERCTRREDDATKVERLVRKAAAALLLEGRQGQVFDGLVTGASAKGTWVRIFQPPVEGRVVRGEDGLDVGDRVRVRLLGTKVEAGFIDFARA